MARLDILERKNDIIKWIDENQSKAFIAKQLKCKPETLNSYLKKLGIDYQGNQSGKGKLNTNAYIPALEYIEKSKVVKSYKLKQKLIRDGLKESKCEVCNLTEWQGKPIPLELHHKNCNHYDNSLDNLQILCPNCHAQQHSISDTNVNNYVAVLEQEDNAHLECATDACVSSNLTCDTNLNKKYCVDCGQEIYKTSTRCKKCENLHRKQEKPIGRDELKELIRNYPMLQIGKKFNVTDNAVRKWCKSYNLPYRVTDIKQISDEDWKLI